MPFLKNVCQLRTMLSLHNSAPSCTTTGASSRRCKSLDARVQSHYAASASVRTLCSASESGLPAPDVRDLARRAQIAVTDQEVEDWSPKIQEIVNWFDQLQAVDVEGVPPALRPDLSSGSRLRDDTPQEYQHRAELVEKAPDREGPYVKVPKIMSST